MTVNADTSVHGRTFYPGPGIVVTRNYILTGRARYRVRDLIIEDPHYFYGYFRRKPRRMELTARYQGRRVVLFVSADQRVFGQVWRAAVRAVEANR
jgi:Family of unknown function (DUF6232)